MILDLKTSLKFLFWDQLKYDKEYPTLWKLLQEVDKWQSKKNWRMILTKILGLAMLI